MVLIRRRNISLLLDNERKRQINSGKSVIKGEEINGGTNSKNNNNNNKLEAGGEGRKGRRGKLGSGMERGVMKIGSQWAVQSVFFGTKQIIVLGEGQCRSPIK